MTRRLLLLLFSTALLLPLNLPAQEYTDERTDIFARDKSVPDTVFELFNNFGSEEPLSFPEKITQRINALLQSRTFDNSHVGIYVYDLTTNEILYTYNEKKRLRPASNEKIITAVTALDLLGGDYLYTTRCYLVGSADENGKRSVRISPEGVFDGELYVCAGFDPLIDDNDIAAIINALRSRGITSLTGDIVVDQSMKDKNPLGKGWCWDDDEGVCTPMLYNNTQKFESTFVQCLQRAGIGYSGYVRYEEMPEESELLCTRTHSLNQVLVPMMKRSDNTYAESMFFQIAMLSKRRYADLTDTQQRINALVARLGLDPGNYNFSDGSGLSIYDIATAELMAKCLIYAYRSPEIYRYLLPSLPIAGVDGTLHSRMKNTPAYNNVRAKTGTVTGVSTLSGYCTAANGHYLVFSILNNGLRNSQVGREFQNRVCVALTTE